MRNTIQHLRDVEIIYKNDVEKKRARIVKASSLPSAKMKTPLSDRGIVNEYIIAINGLKNIIKW